MATFECRCHEIHDDHDWEAVEAYDADRAAIEYAEKMDRKDSELFVDPGSDNLVVLVRRPGSEEYRAFEIGFDYRKSFRTCSVTVVDPQAD